MADPPSTARPEGIWLGIFSAAISLGLSGAAWAQDVQEEELGAKFQTTYVWQRKYPFGAAYTGPHRSVASARFHYGF